MANGNSRARALLIDLDGTLVDSGPGLTVAVDDMLTGLGWPPAGETAVRSRVGGGIGALVEQNLAAALRRAPNDDERRRARALFDASYDRYAGRDDPVYPGVHAGLEHLQRAGLATACVSNKVRRFSEPMLRRLELAAYFDVLVAGDDAGALKPDPAPLALAAERLNVSLVDSLMVGDSAIDVAAARNAGCRVWGLRTNFVADASIDEAAPDAAFDRFDDLVTALFKETCRA